MRDAATRLSVWLLGGLRVEVAGRDVTTALRRHRRAAQLVALLALAPDHRRQREELRDLLWPEHGPEAAGTNLRKALFHARRALGDAGLIATVGETVALTSVWVDAAAFLAAAGVGRGGDAAALERAVALYRGELLPDERYEDWAAGPRDQLRETRLLAGLDLAAHHAREGRPARAIAGLEAVVAIDPTHELAHRRLMALLAEAGQPERALREYDRLRARLAAELDAEPDPSTTRLRDEIAAGLARPSEPPGDPDVAALPVPLTPLIGRDAELARLRGLLSRPETRLVTLVGAPGVGKTRLGLAAAASLRGSYRDGVRWVDLAPVGAAADVASTIQRALGLVDATTGSPVDAVARYLRGRELLLVLDNFEHVLGAAELVGQLVGRALGVKVLATSRTPLRIGGEIEAVVEPLAAAPAIQLFLDRARALDARFEPSEAGSAAVAEICRRLDGLPLAIELAAARSLVLAPEEMLARLDAGLELLVGRQRDLPERHRTLRRALEWSHELLSPAEQAVFRRMAVFAGSFSLAAAEAVCGGGALDGIQALVDASLLVRRPGADSVRFRMLATVRELAAERLAEDGAAEEVRRRHARFFRDLALGAEACLRGERQVDALRRLDEETENVGAALGWLAIDAPDDGLAMATALARYWVIRGRFVEGREWLERLLRARGDAADALQARGLLALGFVVESRSDYRAAEPNLRQALRLAQRVGDRWAEAEAWRHLGFVARWLGRPDEAEPALALALELFGEIGDDWGRAWSLVYLAQGAGAPPDDRQTAQRYDEALSIFRRLGDRRSAAWVLAYSGNVAGRRGDAAGAERLLGEALAEFRAVGEPRGEARCLLGLASLVRARGAVGEVEQLHRGHLAVVSAVGYTRGIALSRLTLGDLALERGHRSDAVAHYRSAIDVVGPEDPAWLAWGLAGLAAALAEDEPEWAARLLGAADRFAVPGTPSAEVYPPPDRRPARDAAAARLGEAVFTALLREGAAMSPADAVAAALGARLRAVAS